LTNSKRYGIIKSRNERERGNKMKYEVVINFDTMETVTVTTREEAYKTAVKTLYEREEFYRSEMLEIAQFFCHGGDLVITGFDIREVWA
jgi:uncharacterized protein (DUF1330 family)